MLSRRDLDLSGAEVAASLREALTLVRDQACWVIGGGQVYAEALPMADVVEVTEVDTTVAGDTHAPSLAGWQLASEGEWQTSAAGTRFRWLRYTRLSGARE